MPKVHVAKRAQALLEALEKWGEENFEHLMTDFSKELPDDWGPNHAYLYASWEPVDHKYFDTDQALDGYRKVIKDTLGPKFKVRPWYDQKKPYKKGDLVCNIYDREIELYRADRDWPMPVKK